MQLDILFSPQYYHNIFPAKIQPFTTKCTIQRRNAVYGDEIPLFEDEMPVCDEMPGWNFVADEREYRVPPAFRLSRKSTAEPLPCGALYYSFI